MKISFRLRMTLLIIVLAGSVLLIFTGVAWLKIKSSALSELDSNLQESLLRELAENRADPNQWHMLHQKLADKFTHGDVRKIQLVLVINHQVVFNTTSLDEATLLQWPWPAAPVFMRGMDGENRRPPPPNVTLSTIKIDGKHWRLGLATTPKPRLAIAIEKSAINKSLNVTRDAFLIGIPFTLLLLGAVAWFVANRALKPIHELTQTMQKISADTLDARLDTHDADAEFSELIGVFNHLLARLQNSFNQATRFSGDAAHELKTPLAIIQGQLERAIAQAPAGSDLQQQLSQALDEARRITAICRKLLLLSQADAGKLNLHYETINVSVLLEELADDARLLAPHIHVHTEIVSELMIRADRDLLMQALQNLITNAIKYNIDHGFLRICAYATAHAHIIDITNSSTGLDTATATHLFERFYRGNHAHHRAIDGVGLGLSITQEIIKAHGGQLTVFLNTPTETGFRIKL